MSQDRIKEILGKYGEPVEGSVWKVQGQTVILHKALERVAARAGIVFDPPVVLRAEREEAVILVTGRLKLQGELPPDAEPGKFYAVETGQRMEWSIGEALVNVNYRVSGRQAAYVYAMAEKRAKDRVILKLIELHGYAYSEDEADDFRDGKPRLVQREREPFSEVQEPETEPAPEPFSEMREVNLGDITVNGERMSAYAARKSGVWTPLVTSLRACKTKEALETWTEEHSADIADLPDFWRSELRDEYKARVEYVVRGR